MTFPINLVKGVVVHLAAIVFFVFLATPSHAISQKRCDEYVNWAKQYNKTLPVTVQPRIEMLRVEANCETMMMTYNRRYLEPDPGWSSTRIKIKQRRHTRQHCDKRSPTSDGWTVVDTFVDKNRRPLVKLVTAPEDCRNVICQWTLIREFFDCPSS